MRFRTEIRPVHIKDLFLSKLSNVFQVPFIEARAGFNTFYLFILMLFVITLIIV